MNTETTFSNSKTNAIYNIPQLSTGYHLQKGTYHLHWRTAGNSEKILKLSFINNVPIEPALFQLPSDENSGTLEFSVLGDGLSLQIDVSFSGSFLEIKDLQLESCEYTDRAFIIALFLCLLLLGLIYIKSEKTVIGWNFAFIFTGVIAVCYPVFSNTFSLGYDGVFHAARIESIKEGLMTFQFPVRCSSFFYNGYGGIPSVFYPDLLIYPFAVMRILGASEIFVIHVFIVVNNILSALSMFICAKQIFNDKNKAYWCSALYVTSQYRLGNIYTRFAVGEMISMSLFPFFILCFFELVFRSKDDYMIPLSVTAACINLSHLISTLLIAIICCGFCLLNTHFILKKNRVIPIIKSLSLTAMLTVFWWVPFIMYSLNGVGAESIIGLRRAAYLSEVVSLQSHTGIGLAIMIGVCITFVILVKERFNLQDKSTNAFLFQAILFGLVLTILSMWNRPWLALEKLGIPIGTYIQFPDRLIAYIVVLFCLVAGWGLELFFQKAKVPVALLALIITTISAVPFLASKPFLGEQISRGFIVRPDVYPFSEYTIPGSHFDLTSDQNYHVDGQVDISFYSKEGNNITMYLRAHDDSAIDFPLFAFKGYKATLDKEPIVSGIGDNNRIKINIPSGKEGMLRIWFAGSKLWLMFDIISLIGWVYIAARWVYIHKKHYSILSQKR